MLTAHISMFPARSDEEQNGTRLTSIHEWYEAADGTDIDDGALGSNNHLMEAAHHTHGTKHVNVKHALHRRYIRVDGRHGISYATGAKAVWLATVGSDQCLINTILRGGDQRTRSSQEHQAVRLSTPPPRPSGCLQISRP